MKRQGRDRWGERMAGGGGRSGGAGRERSIGHGEGVKCEERPQVRTPDRQAE